MSDEARPKRNKRPPEVLAPMPADRRWTADEREDLARRVAAGESSSTIAAVLGRSLRSVTNARSYTPRPRAPIEGGAMAVLNVRVPAELTRAIDGYGERFGVDRSAAVRAVLEAGAKALGIA